MAAGGNYSPISPIVDVEYMSPPPPSSPPPGINNYRIFDEANHSLDLETPHLVTPAVLGNLSIIYNKCRRKHDHVIQRHCLAHGINFSSEDTSRFLPTDHLMIALEEAKEESSALLDLLLLIPNDRQHEENIIRSQMTAFFNCEDSRIKAQNVQWREEFVQKAQGRMWTEFVEKVEARYYFLFADFRDVAHKLFYKGDKLCQYVNNLLEKSQKNCLEYLRILEGRPPGDVHQQKSNIPEIHKSFQSLMRSLQKAGKDLAAKNSKHEEHAKNHISKQLIESDYWLKCKGELAKMIEKDPDLYSTEESVKSVVNGELKDATVVKINTHVKIVCLEEFQEFQRKFTNDLEEAANQLVQYGIAFAKQKQEEVDKTIENLVTAIPDVFRTVSAASGLPPSVMEQLLKNLKDSVVKTKQDRQSGRSSAPSSPSSVGQPVPQRSPSQLSPKTPAAQKHPYPDSTGSQTGSEGKRIRQHSASSTSSTETSVSTVSGRGKYDNPGNNSRLAKRGRP